MWILSLVVFLWLQLVRRRSSKISPLIIPTSSPTSTPVAPWRAQLLGYVETCGALSGESNLEKAS